MPTIRYQIKNEYGLGRSELYGAADKNDPEALLEGVAMAGLVGLLRQLGDLAEFATEVFHNLHEEVMNTASRGHNMILRVQQLETQLPAISNGLFHGSGSSCLSCREGIDWHCNIQVDHNLITAGDMPHFFMDMYEECHVPPQLFKLDKFDVGGDGACLKRYSDPSLFMMELTSSRLVEHDPRREKRTCKTKKKVSFSCGGEPPKSFLMSHFDSRLQPATSGQVLDKVTLQHVKLKPRQLNESVSHSLRSYMENHIDLLPTEQQVASETSIIQSIGMKSADLIKSATEVHAIVVDTSSNREKNQSRSPTKQEMTTAGDSEKQKIERMNFSDKQFEPTSEVQNVHSVYFMLEEKAVVSENKNITEGRLYGSQPSEVDLNLSVDQEVEQNGFSPDTECRSQNSSDGYISDEISSDLDNYMDALTTMESELETDAENQGNTDSVFVSTESQETDSDASDANEEQEELQAQYSKQYFIKNSASSPGFTTIFRKGAANLSFSDTLGHMAAQLLEENKNDSDFPPESDVGLGEMKGTHFEQTYNEPVKCKSSEHSLLRASDVSSSAVHREAFCRSSITDLTSTISLVTLNIMETSPSYERKTDQAVSHLDGESPCKIDASELPSEEKINMLHGEFAKNPGILSDSLHHMTDVKLLMKDDIPKESDPNEYIKEQSTHDVVSSNRPVLHLQKQHETALEVGTTDIEVSDHIKSQESEKHDQGACCLVKPAVLDEDLGNAITGNDSLAASTLVLTHENADAVTQGITPIPNMSTSKEDILSGAHESPWTFTGQKAFSDNTDVLSEPVGIILSTENELPKCNPEESGDDITSDVDFSESNMPSSNETICGELSFEGSIPFQCNSDLHKNTSGSVSVPAPLIRLNKDSISETILQQSSEQQPQLASSAPLPEDNVTSEDTKEILPGRLTKPPRASLVSSCSVAQPPSGSNTDISLSTVENEHSGELLAGVEIAGSDCTVQSPKSCDITVAVKGGYEDILHSDRKLVHPALELPHEEDKPVHDGNAFEEDCMRATELPSTVENESSRDISVSKGSKTYPPTLSEVIPSLNERCQDLELKRSQNGIADGEKHKDTHEVAGSALTVNGKLPLPPSTKPKKSGHGSLSTEEKDSSSLHYLTTPTTENEKPTNKLRLVISRPNDPLIEAIASHDKSKLRKAPQLIHSLPKSDEKGSFLEQIRNKSFNLKPMVAPTVKFKGGPPTDVKVIAILEKANAIRQACAGSDDDDDEEDSWKSDS
ncbi:unnamed protein product [Musa acuminata subsp. malaccensis]|uniref:Protein SCAR n=1 Tax=Musa acuminata subsp. malaccensis TaxID=214687 RepID=A0A804KFZ0_MUSAM|nr:PREDICTED: SCAR-like protein 1 [Musa acuminata subsp. malaccensis]CAG1834196.1 unnamed protein product [Musa acuminata subsp. malaccensis]